VVPQAQVHQFGQGVTPKNAALLEFHDETPKGLQIR
jgi:hypothetical protein